MSIGFVKPPAKEKRPASAAPAPPQSTPSPSANVAPKNQPKASIPAIVWILGGLAMTGIGLVALVLLVAGGIYFASNKTKSDTDAMVAVGEKRPDAKKQGSFNSGGFDLQYSVSHWRDQTTPKGVNREVYGINVVVKGKLQGDNRVFLELIDPRGNSRVLKHIDREGILRGSVEYSEALVLTSYASNAKREYSLVLRDARTEKVFCSTPLVLQ